MTGSRTCAPAPTRLPFPADPLERVTHHLFKFPAKFHPPVVRTLLERYTAEGDTVLDPFCGCGTLLVEASLTARSSVGIDIDPVAVFASRVKTRRLNIAALEATLVKLRRRLHSFRRTDAEYERRAFADVTWAAVTRATRKERIYVPPIPKIGHWFRHYAILDLARILACIDSIDAPSTHRDFFRLCFAATIRPSSNADPVPVSGLEVTSHMRKRDRRGRVVNPFALFDAAARRGVRDLAQYCALSAPTTSATVLHGDATELRRLLNGSVDAVITSPPYHNAVDYYRRHTLETYWLGFATSHADRLRLLPKYIGRVRVPRSHPFLADHLPASRSVRAWEGRIRRISDERARDFKHYVVSMHRTFSGLASLLRRASPAIFVIGRSQWNDGHIPTGRLFLEIAHRWFALDDHFWYPIKNRYMSYARHNGADIGREQVLVLRRR